MTVTDRNKRTCSRRAHGDGGFSLVELIVVILIMAILGVMLAPQVTDWVENARKARDLNNYKQLYSDLQVIMVSTAAAAEIGSATEDYYLVTDASGSYLRKGTTGTAKITSGGIYDSLEAQANGWQIFKKQSSDFGTQYEIKIDKGTGTLEVVSDKVPSLTGDPWEITP